MEERGKSVENYSDFNYSVSEMPCKKHPNSSSVGICAFCLKERLVKLVCSECGEQRLSSCSCSDVSSSYRNSCSTVEIGSVGRISFLLENEKTEQPQLINPNSKPKSKNEQVIFLRRSSSSCVEVKKSNGFWKIKRLFRKKKRNFDKNGENCDEKSEIWVSDIMGVSRSRSLCSLRGNGNRNGNHNDVLDFDQSSDYAFSSAKISDVTSGVFVNQETESLPRKSGFRGMRNLLEFDRTNSVPNRGLGLFPAKESDFSTMDESAFIDLKLDLSSDSKRESSVGRISGASDLGYTFKNETFECSNSKNHGNGDHSCRITVNENGLKRGSKSHKVWKWIFKYHHPSTKKEKN